MKVLLVMQPFEQSSAERLYCVYNINSPNAVSNLFQLQTSSLHPLLHLSFTCFLSSKTHFPSIHPEVILFFSRK